MRRWFLRILLAVATTGQLMAGPPPVDLDSLVANNQRAVTQGRDGPDVHSLEADLAMRDGGSSFDAVYKVTREGKMRIDILKSGKRVYTEAYDGKRGWDLGEDGRTPQLDPHGDALWHGTQFPGMVYTLRDMASLGHKLEYAGREKLDGIEYYVLKLTLSDGFVTYRYLNPHTWLIDRGRDFRAFHPAVDDKKTWVETVWSDYRPVEGVLRPYRSVNNDLGAGKRVASQTVTAFKVNPDFDPAIFEMPAG